ncbi:MAG TPA: glycosyltransferase family 4 protein [Vicinamibacterales bacterium]|jgi:glycogen(starch) synthase|nr:glycosyltransferase family 4 protein [Vicinamibacterales bacterium]
MRILLVTDAFPPVCGGSGWSTYELARQLRDRNHEVLVVQPRPGSDHGPHPSSYDGIRVIEFGAAAPSIPFVRNYFKNERLRVLLGDFLISLISRERIQIVHGQHVLTSLPSIDAARRADVPVICTVRDYWPVCYWSDLIYTFHDDALCPACTAGMMTQCIRPRAGAAWPLALPMIPYMRGNLRRKRTGLAMADAVVAVSSTIATDLRARAPELAGTRIEVIPNPVNVSDLRARAAGFAPPLPGAYALYLGKLAPNKGTSNLIGVVERAGLDWPLVVVGDGPDRSAMTAQAARSGRDVRFTGWVKQESATAWLAYASMLIFPSRGPESLSRVLLEASALGIPIAAMNTGGTADIITTGETGLLSTTPDELADDVRRLRNDETLRHRLGAAARIRAERLFDAASVTERFEHIYAELISRTRPTR